jgi:23S rRNA pseudouridine1911/1915/1917 synthase
MTSPPAHRLTVATDEDGMRVDRFLASRLPGASRAIVKRLFSEGAVIVAGKPRAKGDPVRRGEVVEVFAPEPLDRADWPPAANPDLVVPLLHADEDLLVVDKPAGMPCHPLRPDERGTVANALVARFPELVRAGDVAREAGLVHRLDTATSGVLVFARRRESFEDLVTQIRLGGSLKVYLALVEGDASGISRRLEYPLVSRGRRVVALTDGRDHDEAQTATTVVEPVEVLGDATLVEARIRAGRRHQIRAHLAAAGHPIVGDVLYGAGATDLVERPFLHAHRIALASPSRGTPLQVEAPLPADLTSAIEASRHGQTRRIDDDSAPGRDPRRTGDDA